MRIPILTVTAIGLAIGLTLPRSKSAQAPPPVPAEVAVAAVTASPRPSIVDSPDRHSPGMSTDPSRETVLQRADNGHFFADAEVNGTQVHFVVDTGATTIALTEDDARRAGIAFDTSQFGVVGSGASGDVRGQEVELRDVALDGRRVDGIHALVLEGLTVSLLGQTYLRRLDTVSISGDTMTLK